MERRMSIGKSGDRLRLSKTTVRDMSVKTHVRTGYRGGLTDLKTTGQMHTDYCSGCCMSKWEPTDGAGGDPAAGG
jgi:hypothetical protein